MMITLFVLLALSMIFAVIGHYKSAEAMFSFSLIAAIFYFIHLMTETIDIQL